MPHAVDDGTVSLQGIFAVVMAVVVTVIAVVIVFRRMIAEGERPAVLAAMTPGQRRRAVRQIRRGQPVADDELVGVRAEALAVVGLVAVLGRLEDAP